jgi:hypothetical protein
MDRGKRFPQTAAASLARVARQIDEWRNSKRNCRKFFAMAGRGFQSGFFSVFGGSRCSAAVSGNKKTSRIHNRKSTRMFLPFG